MNGTPEYLDFQEIAPGDIVEGKIVLVSGGDVFVDVGYKTEAVVPLTEFKTEPNEGDKIWVLITSVGITGVRASVKKALYQMRFREIRESFEKGEPVRGKIFAKAEPAKEGGRFKGFIVDLGGGVTGFLPASQTDVRPVRNPDDYLGLESDFAVLSHEGKKIILSRRELLEKEREKARQRFFETVKEGDVLKGKVVKVDSSKATIDLGGVNGLLLVSDAAWKYIKDLSSVLKVGDEVEVKVLEMYPDKGYVRVGKKQLQPDPWENIESRMKVGDVVKGKVVRFRGNNAIVEIEDGVEGIVEPADLSWVKKVKSASDLLKIGEVVEAKILDIDKSKRNLKLGIKQLHPDPWENIEERYPKGSVVRGRVSSVTDFGVFVKIMDGVEGLIRKEDVDWFDKEPNLKKKFSRGQMVEAVVLSVNSSARRLRLGIKQREGNPWENFKDNYPVGTPIEVVVKEIIPKGVVVIIDDKLEGFIPISQLSIKRISEPSEVVSVGDSLKAAVMKVEPKNKRIVLSVRMLEEKESQESVKKYIADEEVPIRVSLGDLLKMKQQEDN